MTDTVRVGAGSYTTRLPAGAKEPAVAPFVVDGVHRPTPTNDWWSSLAFLRHSNQMFPHPLGLQAGEDGLRLYYPGAGYTANPEGVFTAIFPAPDDLTLGVAGAGRFPDARVERWSDWFVTAAFVDGPRRLHLTFGHGAPFVFGTVEGGAATVALRKPPVVFAGDARSSTLGIAVDGRFWALFGPSGSVWEGIGTNRLTCKSDRPYFSVALLPDDKPATLALFARYAHNHVTDSKVTWRYDEAQAQVTVRYAVTTRAWESGAAGTLLALYPHQAFRTKAPRTGHVYQSARGPMALTAGEGFATVTPYHGVLPLLPTLGSDPTVLKRHLATDAAGFTPEPKDTYFGGKDFGKLATLASLADAAGDTTARETFRNRLKTGLEAYLKADDDPSKGLFYYNRAWGTLIGYPASFGSDEALNDHHFHYGYFVRAAAEIARRDPAWAKPERWGGMVNLLIRDFACPDRDDPRFPFLRNFDVYEGHSWADGRADFADGNDNESSSEAMNAWTALILWGETTGDNKIRDLGIYLYVTEKDAIARYWFGAHGQFPAAYTPPMVSMVWGAKAVYATWFSGDPIHMHGINILPIQSGSLYLGTDPALVRRNVAGLAAERTKRERKDPPRVGKRWGDWGDIIGMYQALGDPAQALADTDTETQSIEGGNSRACLYHWLHLLNAVGQVDASVTADAPCYAVFKKGAARTYVVYSKAARKVRFSDGKVVNAPAGVLTVER